ncbi:hypothetical protein AF72_00910 [Xylella taiwanensis]|uniref:Uncharacterized protein n=1 Tax=Xylella taiwanensis TaxID=1444770 RepID=Z9JMQ1_9GAMM|nr:hypothetical protein AF72_00910 [Xylella taiwanensis]
MQRNSDDRATHEHEIQRCKSYVDTAQHPGINRVLLQHRSEAPHHAPIAPPATFTF